MTIIEIPVTRFSKRIIESEYDFVNLDNYDTPVIVLSQNDLLYNFLCTRGFGNITHKKSGKASLSETISIKVSDKLAQRINKNRAYLGHFLNETHREDLLKSLWDKSRIFRIEGSKEMEAKRIIELWCDDKGIELDIDINYDTLYKSWTRYKQKKQKIKAKTHQNTSHFVRQNVRKNHRKTTSAAQKPFLSLEELDTIVDNYLQVHPDLFRFQKGTPRNGYLKASKVCIYYFLGGFTYSSIAKMLKISINTCKDYKRVFQHIYHKYPPQSITNNQ
jgi:hypothetical protein